MARIASTTTAGVPVDPTGGMTLDALMARQKELAAQAGQIAAPRQMTSPWQGAAALAQQFVNARQESATSDQLTAGRDALANLKAGINLDTGPTSQQIAEANKYDPGFSDTLLAMAYKSREEEKTRQATLAAEKLKTEAAGGWKASDLASLRDDYTKAAATYDQAAPSWQSMKEAAQTAFSPEGTTQGKGAADYNMIVGFAKLLDPQSVVREGEVKSAALTDGQIGQLQGWLNQWKQEGMLSDDVRRGIMTQASSRMQAYYGQARTKRDWISDIATRHQQNPDDVVPPLAEFAPFTEAQPDPNNPDPNKPADPNTPPKPPVDPAKLPSIAEGDADAFRALPAGTQYTVPGHMNPEGTALQTYTKKAQPAAAGGQ